VNGRTIGLVEGGFEHQGNAQCRAGLFQDGGGVQYHTLPLDGAGAGQQYKAVLTANFHLVCDFYTMNLVHRRSVYPGPVLKAGSSGGKDIFS